MGAQYVGAKGKTAMCPALDAITHEANQRSRMGQSASVSHRGSIRLRIKSKAVFGVVL